MELQYKPVKVSAECPAGWGRGKTLPEALNLMIQYSRGYINPDKLTLAQFIKMLDNQQVSLRLWVDSPSSDARLEIVGSMGDMYNEAQIALLGPENKGAANG